MRVLIVTAVPPERDAVTSGLGGADGCEVVAGGVGPAAAAASTATALTTAALGDRPYALVVSAGIGGGFPGAGGAPAVPGSTVVADAVVAADLGAETGEGGFASVAELGFGTAEHRPPPSLVRALADALSPAGPVRTGPVLTVSTATGTAERAATLAARHPGAAAEAMEGFGVAEAAAARGLPVLEIRTVSNAVGPRDRDAWRIPEALAALGASCAVLPGVLRAWRA